MKPNQIDELVQNPCRTPRPSRHDSRLLARRERRLKRLPRAGRIRELEREVVMNISAFAAWSRSRDENREALDASAGVLEAAYQGMVAGEQWLRSRRPHRLVRREGWLRQVLPSLEAAAEAAYRQNRRRCVVDLASGSHGSRAEARRTPSLLE
jgi:hypothetical protein